MLDEQGYLPLPGVLNPGEAAALARLFDQLVTDEGDQAGLEAHQEQGADRLANLVDKDPIFDLCWNNPHQLAAISHVLGWQDFKVFSLNGRAALPGQGHQGLHVDWGSAVSPGDYQNLQFHLDARRLYRGQRGHADSARVPPMGTPAPR